MAFRRASATSWSLIMAAKATAQAAAATLAAILEALSEQELVADAQAADPRSLVARHARVSAAVQGAAIALKQR